jgi:hypothetical protein
VLATGLPVLTAPLLSANPQVSTGIDSPVQVVSVQRGIHKIRQDVWRKGVRYNVTLKLLAGTCLYGFHREFSELLEFRGSLLT